MLHKPLPHLLRQHLPARHKRRRDPAGTAPTTRHTQFPAKHPAAAQTALSAPTLRLPRRTPAPARPPLTSASTRFPGARYRSLTAHCPLTQLSETSLAILAKSTTNPKHHITILPIVLEWELCLQLPSPGTLRTPCLAAAPHLTCIACKDLSNLRSLWIASLSNPLIPCTL